MLAEAAREYKLDSIYRHVTIELHGISPQQPSRHLYEAIVAVIYLRVARPVWRRCNRRRKMRRLFDSENTAGLYLKSRRRIWSRLASIAKQPTLAWSDDMGFDVGGEKRNKWWPVMRDNHKRISMLPQPYHVQRLSKWSTPAEALICRASFPSV